MPRIPVKIGAASLAVALGLSFTCSGVGRATAAEPAPAWQKACMEKLNEAKAKWVAAHAQFKRGKVTRLHGGAAFVYKRGELEYTASIEPFGTKGDGAWEDAYGGDSTPSWSQQRLANGKMAAVVVYDYDAADESLAAFAAAFRPALDACVALPP